MADRTGDRRIGSRWIASVLFAAVAIAGCGSDDEGASDSTAEDKAALKQLLLDYAAARGTAVCDVYSDAVLARTGGRQRCERRSKDFDSVTVTVDKVDVKGDSAQVFFTLLPEEDEYVFPAVREGDATDSYDGWRLNELDEIPAGEATTTAVTGGETTATEAAQDTVAETQAPEAQSVAQSPQGRAAVYLDCIEGRGAEGVKQVGLDSKQDALPSVDFSGGGSRVNASFGSSEQDAEQGLATIRQRKPFFVQRFGTVVLYSVGDPLADDLEIGLGCAKEVG